MSRIPAIDPSEATGAARELLAAVQKSLGVTPNLFRVVAQAPAALEGLLGLNGALGRGSLGPKLREGIALAVAESNGCDYCLSAHSYLGKAAGLSESELARAREGHGAEPRSEAILQFARTLVESRGRASAAELSRVRQAGVSDLEVVEIIANVALNIFTNYVNNVAGTEIDFPVVRARSQSAA